MEHYYIIKTKDGEFVKTRAIHNFYMEPVEFCEDGFDWRRWKPEEVEVVEYPTKHGQRRSYKYVGVDIKIKKVEERKERQLKADLEKDIDAFFDKWDKNSNGAIFDENGSHVTIETIKRVVKYFLNARKEE